MSAQATPERPGEWVDGIGWVASWDDLGRGDEYGAAGTARVHPGKVTGEVHGGVLLVIVTRWADGTVPSPPPSPQPDHAELVERLRTEAAFYEAQALSAHDSIEASSSSHTSDLMARAADALAGGHGPQPDEEVQAAVEAVKDAERRLRHAYTDDSVRRLDQAKTALADLVVTRSIPSGGA